MQGKSGSRANGEPLVGPCPGAHDAQPQVAIVSLTQGQGSGAERVLSLLLRELGSSFASRTIVLSPEGSDISRAASESGCPVLPWRATRDSFGQNLGAFLRARRELPAGIRLVHAWTARAFEWAILLARRRGAGIMGTLHDHPRALFHRFGRRLLIRRCAIQLRPMVCVSEALLATCARLGVGRSLLVIRNGLPAVPPATARADGPLRIGFTGMHAAWKGFATIAAWVNRRPTVPLEWHFFGDPSPDLRDGLSALRRAAGASLIAHGRMRPEDIFEQIDVLAHPSVFFDPLPTALIEAARAGIPAVATDVGGSREIVAHGTTGFLFPTSDPDVGFARLQQLASDVALRRRMAEDARRRFDHEFGIGRMADSYLALWRQYLQKPEAEHSRRWPESPACPAATVR